MTKDETIKKIKNGEGIPPLKSNGTNSQPSGVTKGTRQLSQNGTRIDSFSLVRHPRGVTRVQNHKKSSTSKKENKPKEATAGE